MWPFTSKPTLAESGLLRDATDCHSHLLPGVDDGFKTLADSLRALKILEEQGLDTLWLTPHIMEDYPNTTADLRARFEELREAYKGPIRLRLAAENMLDSLFSERLRSGDLLLHGENGDRLLVETSVFSPPMEMESMLYDIKIAGLVPILAHPERYVYMNIDDYRRLRDKGVLLQLNYGSLLGVYGHEARAKAVRLLDEGMAAMFGGDLHRVASLENQLTLRFPSAASARRLAELKN